MVGATAEVSKRYAVLILIIGIFLGCFGFFLFTVGLYWDIKLPSVQPIFVVDVTVKNSTGYPIEKREYVSLNPTLMWHGLLVLVPVIPSVILIFARYRFIIIFLIAGLLLGLGGTISGCVKAGAAWEDILVLEKAYGLNNCQYHRPSCWCLLRVFESSVIRRTAKVNGPCDGVRYIFRLINIYFGLSVVTTILLTITMYVGFVICHNPKLKPRAPKKYPSAYRVKKRHYLAKASYRRYDHPLTTAQPPVATTSSQSNVSEATSSFIKEPTANDRTKLIT